MYLVICNSTSSFQNYDVYLQALDYDGRIRYKFRADDYWNDKFYSQFNVAKIEPVIDKDDTLYLIFSDSEYGDFSIIYAISSDGTLKWKCKLPFAIDEPLVKFFNCDQAGRLYLLYSHLSAPLCLYVINSNGELSWKYEYKTALEMWGPRPPLISEDGTIYVFVRDVTSYNFSSITFDTIHILNSEGKLIERLSIYDLIGYPAEVDALLGSSILSQDGTILAVLSMEHMDTEILLAIGPPSLRKTMLTNVSLTLSMTDPDGKPKSEFRRGETVTVKITIRNDGEVGIGSAHILATFYDSNNVPVSFSFDIVDLGVNEERTSIKSFTLTPSAATGTYRVEVIVLTDFIANGGVYIPDGNGSIEFQVTT
jgi:outer membrane protein assembly factor BamB